MTSLRSYQARNHQRSASESPLSVNQSHSYEWTVPGKDGYQRTLSARATPLFADDHTLLGFVEVFEDVTELRRLEHQLARVERLQALGEMAAGVAHEIRNPLNGITGFASLLERAVEPDTPAARYAHAISQGVTHLNETVTNLLAFTQPKQPQKRATPLPELIEDCLTMIFADQMDGDSPVQLIKSFDAIPEVYADPSQLRQILINIIQNAAQVSLKERGPAAQVQITTAATSSQESPGVIILIDDNGPGVPEAHRQTIFTPFFTTRDEGTGLGLAIVHTLVELHGGTLSVEDSPLGGARFRCCLPNEIGANT